MSKQKLFIKHKDDITIKLSKCQSRNFAYSIASNRKECVEAEAMNQGWIQALKWVLGFDELFKILDKKNSKTDINNALKKEEKND